MNPYFIIPVGWALGQFLFITVKSIHVQKSEKYELGFRDAFRIYLKKDTGPIILALTIMVIAMFMMPEIIAHATVSNGPNEEIKQAKYAKRIVDWMRSFSVVLGIVAQLLAFLLVSRSEKWISKMDKETSNDK